MMMQPKPKPRCHPLHIPVPTCTPWGLLSQPSIRYTPSKAVAAVDVLIAHIKFVA